MTIAAASQTNSVGGREGWRQHSSKETGPRPRGQKEHSYTRLRIQRDGERGGGQERVQNDEPGEESIGNGLQYHVEEFGLFLCSFCCYFVYLPEVNGRNFEQKKNIH